MAGIFKSTTTHYGTFNTLQNRRPSNLLVLPVDDLNPFDPVKRDKGPVRATEVGLVEGFENRTELGGRRPRLS